MTTDPRLSALVANWRARASVGPQYGEGLHDCANELEELLDAAPAPLRQEIGLVCSACGLMVAENEPCVCGGRGVRVKIRWCPPATANPLQHELFDLLVLMPDAQVDELLAFVATLREARTRRDGQ